MPEQLASTLDKAEFEKHYEDFFKNHIQFLLSLLNKYQNLNVSTKQVIQVERQLFTALYLLEKVHMHLFIGWPNLICESRFKGITCHQTKELLLDLKLSIRYFEFSNEKYQMGCLKSIQQIENDIEVKPYKLYYEETKVNDPWFPEEMKQ